MSKEDAVSSEEEKDSDEKREVKEEFMDQQELN